MKAATSMKDFLRTAPNWLIDALRAMSRWQNVDWSRGWNSDELDAAEVAKDDKRVRAGRLEGAEAVGSRIDWAGGHGDDPLGEHIIALDIDHQAVLLPSSTDGHFHLIVDHTAAWEDYKAFLQASAKVGLISDAYCAIALARGETHLRLPWVRKGREKEDASAALVAFLTETDVDGDKVARPAAAPVF